MNPFVGEIEAGRSDGPDSYLEACERITELEEYIEVLKSNIESYNLNSVKIKKDLEDSNSRLKVKKKELKLIKKVLKGLVG